MLLDLIFRKKNCRDFLKVYSEDLYRDIIPNVFEIGILTLQSNFNKILFSKEELEEIILDIKNKENIPNINFKSLHKLTGVNQFNNNNNETEIQNKRKEERNERKFIQKKSNEVYPNWWWDLKNENEDSFEKNKNQIKKMQSDEIKNNNMNYENYNNQNMLNRNFNSNYDNFNQNLPNQNIINRNINSNYFNNEFNQNVNQQNFYHNFNDENYFNDNKINKDKQKEIQI